MRSENQEGPIINILHREKSEFFYLRKLPINLVSQGIEVSW